MSRLPLARDSFQRDESGDVSAAKGSNGACVFLDDSTLCAIHRLGSAAALPVSCRMFPRIVLHDARGTFISLSHFCPTAASMLWNPAEEVAIVDAPEALAGIGELDGLDARDVWPPLLRPGVLMDLESYGIWEARGVAMLAGGGGSARDALRAFATVTAEIARWSPGEGSLTAAVERAFAGFDPALQRKGDARWRAATTGGGCALQTTADSVGNFCSGTVKRWLAARLFANWTAYQGDGLGAIVRYLQGCLRTFEREFAADGDALEAIRRSDLAILHTAGAEDLADTSITPSRNS